LAPRRKTSASQVASAIETSGVTMERFSVNVGEA
jgi:hypothetical protein